MRTGSPRQSGILSHVAEQEVAMGEVFSRFLQTLQMKRDAFVWMDFNDRATGDAFILVALTPVISFLLLIAGVRSLFSAGIGSLLLELALGALIQWLLYSGISWAIVHYGLKSGGEFSTYLRFTGFAYPTTLVHVILILVVKHRGLVIYALGYLWFLVIVSAGMGYASDLPREKALLTAAGSLIALVIVDRIFALTPLI
jgi:hypothetical protein